MRIALLLTTLLVSDVSFAADLSTILGNLRSLINPFMQLVMVFSFILGIIFFWRGLGLLKKFGMQMTMMSSQAELAGPMVYLVVGCILIYLPSSTDFLLRTMFPDEQGTFESGNAALSSLGKGSELLAYAPSGILTEWAEMANTLVLYIQFIGFLSFLRGWIIVAKSGQPGVQPGSLAKGTTHIVGGIIAINFVAFVDILYTSIFT